MIRDINDSYDDSWTNEKEKSKHVETQDIPSELLLTLRLPWVFPCYDTLYNVVRKFSLFIKKDIKIPAALIYIPRTNLLELNQSVMNRDTVRNYAFSRWYYWIRKISKELQWICDVEDFLKASWVFESFVKRKLYHIININRVNKDRKITFYKSIKLWYLFLLFFLNVVLDIEELVIFNHKKLTILF